MGINFESDGSEFISIDPLYHELHQAEIKREIEEIRKTLDELERRVDDPYG